MPILVIQGLSIRCYLDQHVPDLFAYDLRKYGYDVVIAREVGNERATDEAHLLWASEHNRVILTSDFDDFPVLAERFYLNGRNHAGIILMEQPQFISYGELLRRLLKLMDTLTADEMINKVEWLDNRWSISASND